MSLGARNRQQQTAHGCRQHFREKRQEQLELVEEFIVEIEGTGKNHNINRWSRFADANAKTDEMLKRLDIEFEKWLNL